MLYGQEAHLRGTETQCSPTTRTNSDSLYLITQSTIEDHGEDHIHSDDDQRETGPAHMIVEDLGAKWKKFRKFRRPTDTALKRFLPPSQTKDGEAGEKAVKAPETARLDLAIM